jgi:hypothetical protein
MTANAPVWLLYASAAAAVFSTVVTLTLGLSNRRMARRALQVSERQEERMGQALGLYLYDSVSWGRASTDRILGFHVLVSNPSERTTTIIELELHLTYSVARVLTTVKIPHSPELAPLQIPTGTSPIMLPAHIASNGAISGWALFSLQKQRLIRDAVVDRYDLSIKDVHGLVESRQVTVFREASDVQAK